MTYVQITDGGLEVGLSVPNTSYNEFCRLMVARGFAMVDESTRALLAQNSLLHTARVDFSTRALPAQDAEKLPCQIDGVSRKTDQIVQFARVDFSTVAPPALPAQTNDFFSLSTPLGTSAECEGKAPPLYGGATRAPAPSVKSTRANSTAERAEYYRQEVKGLTAEKLRLAPNFDAHTNALKANRELLVQSHTAHPLFGNANATFTRLALHDRIIDACEKWGKDARRYREVSKTIDVLNHEIENIERKAPR